MKKTVPKKKIAKMLLKQENKAMRKDFSFLNGNTLNLALKRQNEIQRRSRRKVDAPITQAFKAMTTEPLIIASSGRTFVKHSEYVADISGSVDFESEGMAINPGNINLFPWLASIAQRFESYKFRALRFRYQPTAPTTTAGTFVFAVIYDATAASPDSKVTALASESAVRTSVWSSVQHVSASHNLNKRSSYFVRNGSGPITSSFDFYDVGTVFAMTDGIPSESGNVGEFYVDYEIDLITPVLTNASTASGPLGTLQATTVSGPVNLFNLLRANQVSDPVDAPFIFSTPVATTDTGATGILADGIRFLQFGTFLVTLTFSSSTITIPGATHFGWNSNGGNNVNVNPGFAQVLMSDTTLNKATCQFIVVANDDLTRNGQYGIFGFGFNTTASYTGTLQTDITIVPFTNSVTIPALRERKEDKHHVFVRSKASRCLKPIIGRTQTVNARDAHSVSVGLAGDEIAKLRELLHQFRIGHHSNSLGGPDGPPVPQNRPGDGPRSVSGSATPTWEGRMHVPPAGHH